jgi:RNA polymerase sigma-70 factor (sigma-E family)
VAAVTFEDFVKAELGGLGRFAGAVTRDRHLAEDVLSDALMATSVRWRKIAVMADPVAYVRRIIVTTYLSEMRKTQRRRTDSTADSTPFDQPVPDSSERVAQRDEIERLLSGLTPNQRTAVVLRYMFDQSDAQIAEVLDCTAGTVRAHLSYARAALRLASREGALP